MNLRTKAGIYADDKLFAALDTTTRLLWLAPGKQIVLTDTVGFINKLPKAFAPAFSATLEEVSSSDLIIHLIDITDKHREMHEQVVLDELEKLGAKDIPVLTVYNKTDILTSSEAIEFRKTLPNDAIFLSAKKNENVEELKQKIIENLF